MFFPYHNTGACPIFRVRSVKRILDCLENLVHCTIIVLEIGRQKTKNVGEREREREREREGGGAKWVKIIIEKGML